MVHGVAPERMSGVVVKVTEGVKEGYWRVIHMGKQDINTGHLTEIWKPRTLMDGGEGDITREGVAE